MVEDFCAQQIAPPKSSKVAAAPAAKDNNAKLFVNRRTIAFSAAQLQQGFAQMGADFDTLSDGFKEAAPAAPTVEKGQPGWLKTAGGQRGSSARAPAKEGAANSPRSGAPAGGAALPPGGGRGLSLGTSMWTPSTQAVNDKLGPRHGAPGPSSSRDRINTPISGPSTAPNPTAAANAKGRAASMAPEPHQMSKRKMLAKVGSWLANNLLTASSDHQPQ